MLPTWPPDDWTELLWEEGVWDISKPLCSSFESNNQNFSVYFHSFVMFALALPLSSVSLIV